MRDPARIDRILAALRAAWVEHPDLRLGQLIVNAIRPSRPCPQVFLAEDTVAEAGLIAPYGVGSEKYTGHEVVLELTADEAVVLFEFVRRFSDQDKLAVEDPAEAQVLYNVCCLLEQQQLSQDMPWPMVLDRARRAVLPAE